MDARFHAAVQAIMAGDVDRLRTLVEAEPTLATARSATSHPTLLQCLVLDAREVTNQIEMARVLIDAGAAVDEPLVAAAGADNAAAVAYLLDRGAKVDGTGGWSPLEEALYWNSDRARDVLLARGASIGNLRVAAGLGRVEVMQTFFDADGGLRPEAGRVNWPWEDRLAAFETFRHDRQGVIDNALVYACMHGHIPAAAFLLDQGAALNTIPGGFDYSGTGLHYAAFNGQRAMVEFLLGRGADKTLKDTKLDQTAAAWANYAGHPDLGELLSTDAQPINVQPEEESL